MTPEEFVVWAQGYYGKYPEGQKRDIWDYLKGRSPEYLAALKKAVMQNYSAKWKCAPDVAVFEECKKFAINMIEAPAFIAIEDNTPRASQEDIAEFRRRMDQIFRTKRVSL